MCIYFYVYYIVHIYVYIYIFKYIYTLHFKSLLLCVYFHFVKGRASIQSMQSDPKVVYGFRPQNWKRRRAMRRWCGSNGKCDRRWPTRSDSQPFHKELQQTIPLTGPWPNSKLNRYSFSIASEFSVSCVSDDSRSHVILCFCHMHSIFQPLFFISVP